ncbi:cell division protein SepF [Lysinibacillus sp. PLM2]|nr:cell division protein SepF [Lysinibacillus sp. PLM2]
MSVKNKIKNFFYLEEEDEEEVVQPSNQPLVKQQEAPIKSRAKKERKFESEAPKNVVSIQAANSMKNSKVVIIEPRVYAEAQDIAEHLKNKRAIIVNLQRIDREQGVRIIDFLSGAVYALAGDIQRIGNDIFLCTPDNVEVSGEVSNYLYDDNQ